MQRKQLSRRYYDLLPIQNWRTKRRKSSAARDKRCFELMRRRLTDQIASKFFSGSLDTVRDVYVDDAAQIGRYLQTAFVEENDSTIATSHQPVEIAEFEYDVLPSPRLS